MDKAKILERIDDMVYDIMLDIQDELGITDGCEPFDVKLDEIEEELADEIRRVIEHQIIMGELNRR